jgi:N-acetylmuramoyl-L-alanine amidase
VTGDCNEDTWKAIVEACWSLGDRLLMLVSPNLRGDDVNELQASLAQIGFDAGRGDGIFGPATARALEDFQENCGLYVDGVCGPDTVQVLNVVARQSGSGPGITAVRELERLTATARSLAEMRIVVGQLGGLSSLSRQVIQALRHRSATVVATDEPDPYVQAAAANRFDATVYVGFDSETAARSTVQFFAVPQFESIGGRALARCIAEECQREQFALDAEGMRLPVLRETRMPAVLVTFGDVQLAHDHAPRIVDAIVRALEAWTRIS